MGSFKALGEMKSFRKSWTKAYSQCDFYHVGDFTVNNMMCSQTLSQIFFKDKLIVHSFNNQLKMSGTEFSKGD